MPLSWPKTLRLRWTNLYLSESTALPWEHWVKLRVRALIPILSFGSKIPGNTLVADRRWLNQLMLVSIKKNSYTESGCSLDLRGTTTSESESTTGSTHEIRISKTYSHSWALDEALKLRRSSTCTTLTQRDFGMYVSSQCWAKIPCTTYSDRMQLNPLKFQLLPYLRRLRLHIKSKPCYNNIILTHQNLI